MNHIHVQLKQKLNEKDDLAGLVLEGQTVSFLEGMR